MSEFAATLRNLRGFEMRLSYVDGICSPVSERFLLFDVFFHE